MKQTLKPQAMFRRKHPPAATDLSPTAPFLIGTYTERLGHVNGRGPGLIPCTLDLSTGAMRQAGEALAIRNPAYLWSNRSSGRLYAASEIYDFGGNKDGSISLLEWDKVRGQLRRLQEISSAGCGPAWVQGDQSSKWLFAANYIEGNVAVFPIRPDGTLGNPTCTRRHTGSGPVASRQEGPHPHAILASPDNHHVYVADLGTDTIHGYEFNPSNGQLTPSATATLKLPPGSGPRHFQFHPNDRFLIVVLELSSELMVLERNSTDGSLKTLNRRKTIPEGTLENHPSELAVTADGRFAYVANRGHDSIAAFSLNDANGRLNALATLPCGGRIPRHIALTPNEGYLLVANQESHAVVAFKHDANTGTLTPSGSALEIGTPCFIRF